MTSLKLGLRNLARNRWRSGLTLAAVAVAVGLMVWSLSLYEGWIQAMVRGATAVETAQVQVHTAGYVDQPRAYRGFRLDAPELASVRRVPGVVAASPRVELHGLVGNEQRSQVARILGVDPELERRTTPVAEAVTAGRWLADEPPSRAEPREVVVGSGVARQLQVEPGDELVTFLEAADGSLGNDLLRVVGIVRTGNTALDQQTVYLHLSDARTLGALEGEVHELAIRTEDLTRAAESAREVAAALGARVGMPEGDGASPGEELVVRPWQEVLPGVNQMIVVFRRSYWILYLLVYLLAAAGILNTQRMSALERRREFGVMMAIGMRPRRMFRTLVVESGVVGVLGALIGAAGGAALSWYHQAHGLDMSLFTDQAAFSYMGVAFTERLYFDLTLGNVVEPVLVMLGVALLSGLWPAIRSARIDPAPTIAGRTE
ncbi:MAG: ABC transporter permease [Candidatus Palauibacterales bacterium]|nr:ABC transporter permease [Candidatus Palauibacterales bacterium]